MDEQARALLLDAFDSNWVAPMGPHVEAFESDIIAEVGTKYAVAVASGTAALHLILTCLPIVPGDTVLVSTLTFAASVFPVRYLGGRPVFVDSERQSWNLDPELLAEELQLRARRNSLPKAVVVTHLYGQTANMAAVMKSCQEYGVPVIEDAAEALGARYATRSAGTLGWAGFYSFNGNKVITTSGGGMIVTNDVALATRARHLSTQAREAALHYEHCDVGYNYRMSNLLAAVGRGQLRVLDQRVAARREVFRQYHECLGSLEGLSFMPQASWGFHSRWLTTLTVDPVAFGIGRAAICSALEDANIEARPVWKPMHQQPVFQGASVVGGGVADALFRDGMCLPSSSSLTQADIARVCDVIAACAR